jgi:hypothetical protein
LVTAERKQRNAEARRLFTMPYKVGDILHHSWGHEQTNCDFYQVVGVKGKTVVLKKIGSKTVPGSEGFMSDSRMPVKDDFITSGYHALSKDDKKLTPEHPTIEKRVSVLMEPTGTLRYYIPTPYGWCDLWDGKSEYSSHYA